MLGLRILFPILLLSLFVGNISFAAESKRLDSAALLRAIEDYRFQDYDKAITALEALHTASPSNVEVLQYLAYAYEESGRFKNADRTYAHWRKLSKVARDAWVRGASVLGKLGRDDDATELLDAWLTGHSDDLEARKALGTSLVKMRQNTRAQSVWRQVLDDASASATDGVEAHYYLAILAYRAQESEKAEAHAKQVINQDRNGAYGKAARQLLASSGERRQGFSGHADVGGYYTSNVALLPDVITLQPGEKRQDYAIQANLNLKYKQPAYTLSYYLQSDLHQNNKKFDLVAQIASVSVQLSDFTVAPVIEYIMLGRQKLYAAEGVNIQWGRDAWEIRYRIRAKQFNHSYGDLKVDLGRLGGVSNTFDVQYHWQLQKENRLSLGGEIHDEVTKGDATHPKSDSFRQITLSVGYMGQVNPKLMLGADLRTHYRKYRNSDTSILSTGEVRKDTFARLGLGMVYQPFEQQAHHVLLNASWQKNYSNYEAPLLVSTLSKSYQEWRFGLFWRYQW